MSARKAPETEQERAAWDRFMAEQERPLVKRLDKERTAHSLPSDTQLTCHFCPATAWWQVEFLDEWGADLEPDFLEVCGEHLYTAFS